MLQFISTLWLSILLFTVPQAQETPLTAEALQPLSGLYTGTLTYTDYQSNELTTMPLVANVTVKDNSIKFNIEINEGGKRYDQNYSYKIKDGGIQGFETTTNDWENGRLVLSSKGKDANRPAQFRHTFMANEMGIRITKEVKFLDETNADYFIRNQYTYVRLDAIDQETPEYADIDGGDAGIADVNIPAGQEFMLGEYTSSGYQAKLIGQGSVGILVVVIDKTTKKQTQGFGMGKFGKATVQVGPNEMMLLRNESGQEASIRIKLNKDVQGMGYRDLE